MPWLRYFFPEVRVLNCMGGGSMHGAPLWDYAHGNMGHGLMGNVQTNCVHTTHSWSLDEVFLILLRTPNFHRTLPSEKGPRRPTRTSSTLT